MKKPLYKRKVFKKKKQIYRKKYKTKTYTRYKKKPQYQRKPTRNKAMYKKSFAPRPVVDRPKREPRVKTQYDAKTQMDRILSIMNRFVTLDQQDYRYKFVRNVGALIAMIMTARGLYVQGRWVYMRTARFTRNSMKQIWEKLKDIFYKYRQPNLPNVPDHISDELFDEQDNNNDDDNQPPPDQGPFGLGSQQLQTNLQRLKSRIDAVRREQEPLEQVHRQLQNEINQTMEAFETSLIQEAAPPVLRLQREVPQPESQEDQEMGGPSGYDYTELATNMVDLAVNTLAPPGVKQGYNIIRSGVQAMQFGNSVSQVLNDRIQEMRRQQDQQQNQPVEQIDTPVIMDSQPVPRTYSHIRVPAPSGDFDQLMTDMRNTQNESLKRMDEYKVAKPKTTAELEAELAGMDKKHDQKKQEVKEQPKATPKPTEMPKNYGYSHPYRQHNNDDL